MIALPDVLVFWHWWIAGVLLLGLEMVVPGTFFLWMGVAAGVVGALLLFMPDISWQIQFLVFAILSVITIVSWRRWQKAHPTETDHPLLNRRAEQYVGRVVTLDTALKNGRGKARVDDTVWQVVAESGGDAPSGTQMRITGTDGSALTVEPA
jgi:hypothetical protein